MSIQRAEKIELIKNFANNEVDNGSPEVQCAILTKRIDSLTGHFKVNPKDFQSKIGLLAMVNTRKRLLKYLKSRDESRYLKLIDRLKLRR